jgi:hypothetical protein
MRSVLSFIFVFFISATGQTALSAISDDILYDDINSLYGWKNPGFFNNGCRNTPLITIDKHSVTEKGFPLDDFIFSTQPEIGLLPYDHAGKKRLDYFIYDCTKFPSTGYRAMYAGAEIYNIDNGRDDKLANSPGPGNNFYDEVVLWIKEVYHGWVAKDHYYSTRLLLLSFGLVGIVGIRRKFKKD